MRTSASKNETGQSLIEYVLLAAMVALIAAALMIGLGHGGKTTRDLTVEFRGDGVGSVTWDRGGGALSACPSTQKWCTVPFAAGREVTFVAIAAHGSIFAGWKKACAGSAQACLLTMSENKKLIATFDKIP